MGISLVFEDRGFGRAYVLVEADLIEGIQLKSTAKTPSGQALPTSILKAPKPGAWVLVAPLLSFDYDVVIESFSSKGVRFDRVAYRIGAKEPTLQTPPSSALLASGLDDIRYSDLNPRADATWIQVEKLIDFEDGTEVVHCDVVVALPSDFTERELPVPTLTCLDLSATRERTTEPLLVFGERSFEKGVDVARLQLSFRVKAGLEAFLVWVSWNDPRLSDGFFVAEPWLLGRLRWEWWATTHADSNKADYHGWFVKEGRADDRTLHVQARTTLEGAPLFSVIVPVFQTPLEYLAEALESVANQTYRNWELVLVNASPENEALSLALEKAQKGDARVRVITLEKNLGIACNTQVGVHAAKGEYLCFLDHDDLLEPNALFEYAKVALAHPEVSLIYSDEDLLIDGHYVSGAFKPDFDRDLLFNQNYVTHFLCVSRSALEKLEATWGLPGREFEGAQDYALSLFVTSQGGKAWHVRKFLYHWRAHEGSTATDEHAKTFTDDAGRRALLRALEGLGLKADVAPGFRQNHYDVIYRVPTDALVSVIICRRRAGFALKRCLEAFLAKNTYPNVEFVVVNPYEPLGWASEGEDARTRALTKALRGLFAKEELDELTSVHGLNELSICEVGVDSGSGIACMRNAGAARAHGQYLFFLDDICVARKEGCVEALLGPEMRSEVAITGAALYYADDLVRHLGVCLPKSLPRFVNHLVPIHHLDRDYYALMPRLTRGVSGVSGSALMAKADAYWRVGGFDEGFQSGYDDVDLCLRLREEGSATVVVPKAEFTYVGEARNGRVMPFAYFGQSPSPKDRELCLSIKADEGRFRHRWGSFYSEGDPFYNSQLLRESCHYQIYRP